MSSLLEENKHAYRSHLPHMLKAATPISLYIHTTNSTLTLPSGPTFLGADECIVWPHTIHCPTPCNTDLKKPSLFEKGDGSKLSFLMPLESIDKSQDASI